MFPGREEEWVGEEEDWWEKPTWGESTLTATQFREQAESANAESRTGSTESTLTRNNAGLTESTLTRNNAGLAESKPRSLKESSESLDLARKGKISYADILNTVPRPQPVIPQTSPQTPTPTPPQTLLIGRRSRKDSTGSNKSDKKGGARRKGRGRRGGTNTNSFYKGSTN